MSLLNSLLTETGGVPSVLPSGQIYVGNASNQPTAVSMSGDVTVSNTGVATIKTDVALAGSPTTTSQSSSDNSTKIATTAFTQAAIVAASISSDHARGLYDASINLFPSSGGSGIAGAIERGDYWTVSIAGILGGEPAPVGSFIFALIDNPGQTSSNWQIIQSEFLAYQIINIPAGNISATDVQAAINELDGAISAVNVYSDTFDATTDWGAASGGLYTIIITAATHGFGLNVSNVVIYETVGADSIETAVNQVIINDTTGDVSFNVTEAPDGRFAGKVLIVKGAASGSGSGITTLNTLTTATQTFATGTSGSNFNISSTGSTHTFNIPDAAVGARGLLNTSGQTIEGAKIFDDNLSTNGFISAGTTIDVLSGQGFNQTMNIIGGQINIPAGSPVTGTNILGTNLAQGFIWSEDIDGGAIPEVGLCGVGYVGYLLGQVSGKTVDTINMEVAGVSDQGSVVGSVVTNLNMHTSLGVVGGAMNLTVTNTRFYHVPTNAGGYATNEFGFVNNSPLLDNYFDKSVTIGGGPDSKTTNAEIALEIKSLKTIKLPIFTTAQKNAVASPEEGMILFDTTLNKICVYSGAGWETVTSI